MPEEFGYGAGRAFVHGGEGKVLRKPYPRHPAATARERPVCSRSECHWRGDG